MTWFKRDDRIRQNPKVRKARRRHRLSMYLWQEVGGECGAVNSDGLVTRDVVEDVAHDCYLTAEEVEGCIEALVYAGLWHDRRTLRGCEVCKGHVSRLDAGKLAADEWYFHDWLDYQPTKVQARIPEEKWKEARRKELSREKGLRDRIIERDGHQCRYCAKRVDFKDRHTDDGGTYDHVDPDGPNELWNVVVACRGCNCEKKDRTPDEWGRPLLPEPDRTQAPAEDGSDRGLTEVRPPVRVARDSGRVGPGSSPGLSSAEPDHATNGASL